MYPGLDLHLRVLFGPRPREPTHEELLAWLRRVNFGFGEIERLKGNIAYLTINEFIPSDEEEVPEAIAGFMSKVADADALIIDLRENYGGSPETVALVASYVFNSEPVHLNDMIGRDGSVEEFWTLQDVNGTRFNGKKPVYVLTSAETAAGGEEFAYDLQCLERATIIGETTLGAASPQEVFELDEWFRIVVPNRRPVNPITKTNWERIGIVPDISVPAETALEEAHRHALRHICISVESPDSGDTVRNQHPFVDPQI